MPHPSDTPGAKLNAPIIVHSHLRWDFVWQRPQQLMSRLSERAPILFVEEPLYQGDSAPRLELTWPLPTVCRAVPVLAESLRHLYDNSITIIRELLRREMSADGALGDEYDQPVQWFYTPMPAPAMIGAFGERAIVYDCMDELSQFRFAPKELVDREKLLISEADVVFTGGFKLWQAKAKLHANVHFFGCGVDVAHFATAGQDDLPVPADVASLSRPMIGYYGVIDERLDYALLRRLSAALPDVSVVMVGPVVKVAPDELPQAHNIHWIGQRPYAELPSYVKRFDACLMPFALNEATEYINPTKTLEYMAAGKPIVSTAIADVIHHFTPIVAVGYSHAEFVKHVRHALAQPDEALIERGRALARDNSWEKIVRRMEAIVCSGTDVGRRRSAQRVSQEVDGGGRASVVARVHVR